LHKIQALPQYNSDYFVVFYLQTTVVTILYHMLLVFVHLQVEFHQIILFLDVVRDKELVYNNLVACQDLFMDMTPPSRRNSEFCKRVGSKLFPKQFTGERHERYKTINAASFYRHKTIEVRTHEGTVDPDEIIKWVSLLIKIANYKKKLKRNIVSVKKVVDIFKINPTYKAISVFTF